MKNGKYKRYLIGGGVVLLLFIIVALVILLIQAQRSIIVSAPTGTGDNSDLFGDVPGMVLAGDRDGNGRTLLIPSGKQIGVACEEDDEILVLSIPAGGSGSAGTLSCVKVDPTATPSPTDEPEPTPTDEPTAVPPTPEPTAVGSLPLCAEHDDNAWHGLVSEDGACHYGHTHGDDIFSDAFADYPAWPFAQTISYPHQTPNENELKHAGYKDYGFSTPNDDCVILKNIPGVDGCVVGGRIQFHVVGGAKGLGVRFHSFYAQFKIRNDDGSFGYVGTGGWSDFGILHCTYKQAHCALDSDPDSFNLTQPPYRAGRVGVGDGVSQWNNGCHNSTQVPCDYNQIASYDWVTFDDWGGVNPDDLAELLFSDDPERNHSTLRFYEFIVITPPELGNGRINYEGFTDLTGTIDASCTAAGPECVPLLIENVDAGMHAFREVVGTSGQPPQDRYYREFDVSPAGESWIEYPN